MFHPDTLYDAVQIHHEELRKAAAIHRAAKLARGEQTNLIKAIIARITALSEHNSPQPVDVTQTSEIPQMQLG